jgi:hypothetical protein
VSVALRASTRIRPARKQASENSIATHHLRIVWQIVLFGGL